VPDLAPINWIVMERDWIFRLVKSPEVQSDNPEDRQVALPAAPQFEEALHRLNQAIHTDWEWVKFHTRLQVDALRWERSGKQPDYLLRGAALREAQQWLGGPVTREPAPTAIQMEFVQWSQREEQSLHQRKLDRADRWWEREENLSPYAPDFELICIHCGFSYTFTPSEHLPMPGACPSCGFQGKGSFKR